MSIDLTDLNNWPEGAEAYVDGRFVKCISGVEHYSVGDQVIIWSISPWSIDKYKSSGFKVTMRPQEPKKYQPKIDEICLGNIRNDSGNYLYVEVKPLYNLGSEWAVQCVDASKLSYCDEFRPLKSKTEQELDFLIDKCSDCELTRKILSSFAEKLNEAGWTPPKGDKK